MATKAEVESPYADIIHDALKLAARYGEPNIVASQEYVVIYAQKDGPKNKRGYSPVHKGGFAQTLVNSIIERAEAADIPIRYEKSFWDEPSNTTFTAFVLRP